MTEAYLALLSCSADACCSSFRSLLPCSVSAMTQSNAGIGSFPDDAERTALSSVCKHTMQHDAHL